MKIISISETPNHNTMKITLSESREGMTSDTYTKVDDSQPAFINDILKVEGVKSIFHVMDFISVDKEMTQLGNSIAKSRGCIRINFHQLVFGGIKYMEILRIEPTPSPNTMKVVLSYTREDKLSNTYKKVEETQPRFINQLLSIDGITSIFHVMNFLAVDKAPKADWEVILPDIKAAFSDANKVLESVNEPQIDNHFGEIKAELLTFKGIPYQIKLTSADQELREQLPQTYVDHMTQAQTAHDNIVFMRKWLDFRKSLWKY